MNSVIMDNVIIGKESIVGALSFIPEGTEIPERKVVVGNPYKIVKDVTDEMIAWKTKGTELYQQLPEQLYKTLRPCDPLRFEQKFVKSSIVEYKSWKNTKNKK